MLVRANYPHHSSDGVLHEAGSSYELTEGNELALRLKDAIVRPADALPVVPSVAQTVADAKKGVDAAGESAPPPASGAQD